MVFDTLTLVAFVGFSSLVLLVAVAFTGRNRRWATRLQELSTKGGPASQSKESFTKFTQTALPRIGKPLAPTDLKEETRLRARLIHAGYYSRHAMYIFLGVKMILIFVPLAVGAILGTLNIVPLMNALVFGLFGSVLGMVGSGFWLDQCKSKRQTRLRRSLPDALDMVVICLQGGLSLQGAFQRVTSELGMAHPDLAVEMGINQREIQLGRSTGEALRQFADRCDLEEMRSLASVVLQSERLGASTTKAMNIYAETLRAKRMQRAEEMAHTAGTKMLFPMLLCIFPAILVVVLGPAVIQLALLFSSMGQ